MLILSILLFQFIRYAYQWREFKYYECYKIASPIDKVLAGKTEFASEECPQNEYEQYFESCYTRIIDGIIYSGCMDRKAWEFSSICYYDRRKREYTTDMVRNFRKIHENWFQDGLGNYMFDDIEAYCCTTTLCNDLKYFQTLYWAIKPVDRTYFTEMYTEGMIVFGICLLSLLFIIYELFQQTALFEDEPRQDYAEIGEKHQY